MKKATKIILITASALIVIGAAVFVGALAMSGWNIERMMNVKYETNSYVIDDKFEHLNIDAETDDIILCPSEDNTCKVVCYEQESMKHSAKVNKNTLEISGTDERKWYERIALFSFDSPKITVFLPQKNYSSLSIHSSTGKSEIPKGFTFDSIDITGSTGDVICNASSKKLTRIENTTGSISLSGTSSGELQLKTSTGSIQTESVTCKGDISAKVSTGKLTMTDTTCKSLATEGSTGNVALTNVIASQAFSLERTTGNIDLHGCDAGELFIKTSTGNVTGSLLSEKVFITDTSTGNISVPKTASGGKCEITTSTGNITIDINEIYS